MSERTRATPRDLFLVRGWQDGWLGMDLVTGDGVVEFATPDHGHPLYPGAVVVCGTSGAPETQARQGLRVSEALLWSLLDPLQATCDEPVRQADRVLVETSLRGDAARFRRRLAWWQALPAEFRSKCHQLLKGYEPDLTSLLRLLDAAPIQRVEVVSDGADEAVHAAVTMPPIDPDGVFGWLGATDGLGGLYGPDFAPRDEQAEMGRRVSTALRDRQPLLIEAGTGVGKTLGYLVPLVAQVVSQGTRAVVSTHTRALQTQILQQDLPRLRPLLGERTFTMLMGRRNYLCRRQRQAFLSRPVEDLNGAVRAVAFRLWLHETRDGLRDEIACHPLLAPDTSELFDGTDLCLPVLCYDGGQCFVQKARRRARGANILVVNHSLLLHDQKSGHTLFGDIDHLVVDEAHRLPDVTIEIHTVTIGRRRLRALQDALGRGQGRGPDRIAMAAKRLQSNGVEGERGALYCEDFARAVGEVESCFDVWWQGFGVHCDGVFELRRRGSGRVRIRDKDEAFAALRSEIMALEDVLSDAIGVLATLSAKVSVIDDLGSALEDDLAQLAMSGQLLRQLHQDIRFITADPGDDWVTWLEPGRRQGVARLGASLLDAGAVLRGYWQDDDRRPVMTSATLAVGGDFSHLMGELGLTGRHPATPTHTCYSPFDYHRQAMILVPRDFPAPNSPEFGSAVGDVLCDLARGAGRKTLGLFTSYRLLGQAHDVLLEAGLSAEAVPDGGAGDPIVLAQTPGSGSGALMRRFRRHRRALLLGTTTFWEGVDFPGEDLEILVVTKLPFLVPSDPWVEARCEKVKAGGDNPFTHFIVRDAVLRLRQGFGRLIRRTSDRGVVIILDNRLHTKNYGTTFLKSLPLIPTEFGGRDDLLDRVNGFFATPK